ncbi:MAG: type II toxin-antitoxin system antitoxin, RelB/DinJ family [Synergistaceae bacterium]|nr:type II toxin-antitoxin system antitoxin, RelB/DinJ family [Synergistaceae bacterium]
MQETLTLEIDSGLKSELDSLCRKLGMNISAAFAIFARKFISEQTTVDGDTFYSPSNIAYLEKVTAEMIQGQLNSQSMS